MQAYSRTNSSPVRKMKRDGAKRRNQGNPHREARRARMAMFDTGRPSNRYTSQD